VTIELFITIQFQVMVELIYHNINFKQKSKLNELNYIYRYATVIKESTRRNINKRNR
jgi:hypothetical protein